MADTKPVGFIVACKSFFGFLPDQTLMTFRDEISKLTPKDREELIPLLEKELGITIARSA